MSEAVNLPSSRMENCSVSYNLRGQEKKNSTMYFHVLVDERANCWGKIAPIAEERMLCFLGTSERLL